jgi:hypothetical protein
MRGILSLSTRKVSQYIDPGLVNHSVLQLQELHMLTFGSHINTYIF